MVKYNTFKVQMKKKVLDITHLKCPMIFIKTKEFLKQNCEGQKTILMKGQKDYKLLSNSLKKNYSLSTVEKDNEIFEITLL